MANLNKVYLMGRLTRDPELRYTPKGTAVTDIGMAVNRYRGGAEGGERIEETTFVDVTLWGKQAETANQYLGKGSQILIEGRLQLDSWEDKSSGQKRSKLKVVGESFQFVGSKGGNPGEGGQSSGGGGEGSYERRSEAPRQQQQPQQQAAPSSQPSYQEEEEDDIPF